MSRVLQTWNLLTAPVRWAAERLSRRMEPLLCVGTLATTRCRVCLWILFGVLALSMVLLKEVGGLLSAVESSNMRSYSASVFTGLKVQPWNTDDLRNAITLWHRTDAASDASVSAAVAARPPAIKVRTLLRWHLGLDAIVFVPAYTLLLGWCLRRVGAAATFTWRAVVVLGGADLLETAFTWFVLDNGKLQRTGDEWLVPIQYLGLGKWIALIAVLVTIAALWMRPEDASLQSTRSGIRGARLGQPTSHAFALIRLMVLVTLFAALIALPAGGPLDQIPDVIRHQVGGGFVWVCSVIGVVLFCACVMVAGFLSTARRSTTRAEMRGGWLVGLTTLWSVTLCGVAWAANGRWTLVPAAPVLVLIAVIIAAWLARQALG